MVLLLILLGTCLVLQAENKFYVPLLLYEEAGEKESRVPLDWLLLIMLCKSETFLKIKQIVA